MPKTQVNQLGKAIVVLNDGETFSSVDGAKIFFVPLDADTETIEELLGKDDALDGFYISDMLNNVNYFIKMFLSAVSFKSE